MKTIILNMNYKSKIGLLIFFVSILNFQSISKSHLLISKTTYNTACSVSKDTHSTADYKLLEDISHNTEGAVFIELIDSEVDFFETGDHCDFKRSLLNFSLYFPFIKSNYKFISIDLLSPPPRY